MNNDKVAFSLSLNYWEKKKTKQNMNQHLQICNLQHFLQDVFSN